MGGSKATPRTPSTSLDCDSGVSGGSCGLLYMSVASIDLDRLRFALNPDMCQLVDHGLSKGTDRTFLGCNFASTR